ncbi:MAG: Tim44-like domain-containing protein [Hydrogenophaga sp.]|uniref:Tim44 domain-containing protein n=1 Tax=Hydrogenophaga sp. TaxID=1904254 RepID=UPI00261EC408|nr:Tim44-like domain-containing protein [Hydrogenophaga sp.]MDM7942033.1 Tim44-like domain-containing protein [Hydrogenophaga sp.]
MKKWISLLAVVMTLGLGAAHFDAEAKRMGGGKSFGMQRQATPPAKAPAAPTATPAAAGAGAAAASTGRSWMGPIAGLAAGLGLMALASHLGFGEGLANMLMIGLMIAAAIAVFGFIMRKRAMAQQGGSGGLAYASAGASRQAAPQHQTLRTPVNGGGGSMIGASLGGATASRIPADFDVQAFERNAKVNFIRLQAANDAGNLDDIRAFTTPEMFAELQMDLSERDGAAQHTDVVRIEAEVLEVEEGDSRYVVSVRFAGETRDSGADSTESFDEIWHLTKPRQGQGGWLLAGIQQSS